MKTFIFSIVFTALFFLPCDNANELLAKNVKAEITADLSASNSYTLVYKDGSWYLYEYNNDGGLVNIFPVDD